MRIKRFLEKWKMIAKGLAWFFFGIHLLFTCPGFILFYLIGRSHHSGPPFWTELTKGTFLFLFGDGNPNQGTEEQRWKMIAQCITSNGGVVSAEQLSPFLDLETIEEMHDDELYIPPTLKRFDGYQVDEEGDILYRFPSLHRAAARRGSEPKDCVEKLLKEKQWQPTDPVVRDVVVPAIVINLVFFFPINGLDSSL